MIVRAASMVGMVIPAAEFLPLALQPQRPRLVI